MRALWMAAAVASGIASITACGTEAAVRTAAGPAPAPQVLEQPIGEATRWQCGAAGAPHTVHHAIHVAEATRLELRVNVAESEHVSAEFLVKDPRGATLQRLFSDPTRASYSLGSVAAAPGTWEVVVVCHEGASAYVLHVDDDRALATTLR